MDKKIILVLLILLVLAIYYCYTHESFTENFKSVADIVKGGGVIENFELVSIVGSALTAKSSNGGYTFYAGGATDAGGVAGNSLDLHAYKGDGSYQGHLATFRNNNVTDFYGPVNASGKITSAGRDLLAEIDALKAGNATKGGTDTNKAIDDLGKLAAQLLNSGNLTVPGNLTTAGEITGGILQAKNSNGKYTFFAGGATDAGGVAGNSLDLHAYKGDGSWMGTLATFRNNKTTDFYGPVNATAVSAPQLQAKNSNGGYIFYAGNATDAGGVAGNSLDLHAYKGDGSYQGHLATFRNNGKTDFYGPVNASKLSLGGKGMRIFQMSVGDQANQPVTDPDGRQYNWNEWVCSVQGLRMDWTERSPGAIYQSCYKHSGGLWYLYSEAEYQTDSGTPIILAIPMGFFENVYSIG